MTTTTIQSAAGIEGEALDQLRRDIIGRVLVAGDEGYDEARTLHDFSYDRRPAVIVQPIDAHDVAEAVRFARASALPLAVKSGGHSLAGHSSVDGALVVDLSVRRGVEIDPLTRTARVEPGATSGDLAGPAHEHGLALSTGDTDTVGVGGLALGGGIGWMARKHGLSIDNLISAQVVTADGRIVRASADEHPDLFWALRGGGGNFGIVTEFEFRLAAVDTVQGGVLVLPATREVIRGYLDYTPGAPEELTTIAAIMQAPPAPFIPEDVVGQPVFAVFVTVDADVEAGERALAPLRALATPIADTVETIPYPGMYAYMEVPALPHGAAIRSMFADTVTDEAIDAGIAQVAAASSPFNMVQFRGLGGAIARVPSDATAFGNRDARLLVAVIGIWFDPEDDGEAHREWTEHLWSYYAPQARGVYVNFLQDEGEERKRSAYGEANWRRLAEVKRRYDPENLFRFNQNIKPQE